MRPSWSRATALFSSRSFPLHSPTASSFSLPFPCFVESSSSALASARGSTTVFRGVNKVDAGANSVYFALFFQKNVCARERTSAYRGKCGQTTSFYFYVSSFSSFFIPLNRFPGVNVLSLGCYLTLPSSYLRILLFLFSFLFFFSPSSSVGRIVSLRLNEEFILNERKSYDTRFTRITRFFFSGFYSSSMRNTRAMEASFIRDVERHC